MDGPQTNFELPPVNPSGNGEQFSENHSSASEAARQEVHLPQPENASTGGDIAVTTSDSATTAPINNPASTQTLQTGKLAIDDDSPAIADDTDLIEKEWVNKAKKIVEDTKTDPHRQNHELSKFKAGYIKKRYNKDIQVSKE